MRGYYQDGEWVSAVVGERVESTDEVELGVAEAVKRVEDGQSTAYGEMKGLLARFPSLKRDTPENPLSPLTGLFAREVFGGLGDRTSNFGVGSKSSLDAMHESEESALLTS
jgi:hypothetical protein